MLMDPSSFANPPVRATRVDEPIPVFPTVWTPSFDHAPTIPPSYTGKGDAGSGAFRPAAPIQQPCETHASNNASPVKIRRRNRMITSCLECRRRKLRCDRLQPCSNCSKSKRDCLFLAPVTDATSRMKLTELKEKIGSLERGLEQDAAVRHGSVIKQERQDDEDEISSQFGGVLDTVAEEDNLPFPDDEKNLEPTPLAVQDAAYEDEADDDSFDLGFRIGKMRMTERFGGLFRPRIADELTVALETLHVSDTTQRYAQPQVERFLPREIGSYFEPSDSYIAPRSDFVFGGAQRYILAGFLPTRAAADRLLQQYWEAVHPIAKIVHHPSFETQYASFWADVSRGIEPPFSLQALVFAALFSAVVSMSEENIAAIFGASRKRLIDSFQLGTEVALGKANFLKTAKTQTLQALVMYMIPMCRSEISRAHSALVGMAIRLAECMGFHRDPEEYGHGPVESHVRRMIWYQLCFLDLLTSELQGPRPSIRREDFSTKFPVNMDDSEIATANPSSITDMPRWTDMTFTRIRFECHELRRLLLNDRVRLEKKKVSLTQVLAKVEAFRKATYAKYGPLIHVPDPKPIQKAARLMLSVLLCRAYLGVLHRYLNGVAVRIPERLSQISVTCGTQMLEDSITLETSPELSLWAWYQSALNPYHGALLLLMEVWCNPTRREADRIWRCLDYVYELPLWAPELCKDVSPEDIIRQRDAKARLILTVLRDRMNAYRERRKLKAPMNMADPKTLPPVPERRESYAASFKTEAPNTGPGTIISQQSQMQENSTLHSTPLAGNIPQQYDSQFAIPSDPRNIQPQSFFSQPQNYPPYMLNSLPSPLPSLQGSTLPPHSLQRPSLVSATGPRLERGSSGDSEQFGSDDSGSSLWFVSGTGLASAGAAPPMVGDGLPGLATGYPQPYGDENTMPVDIDWKEWDEMFLSGVNSSNLGTFPPAISSLPSYNPPELHRS